MNVGFIMQSDRRLMPSIPTVEQPPMRWLVHGAHDRVGKDDFRLRQEFVEMRPREPTGSQSSPVRSNQKAWLITLALYSTRPCARSSPPAPTTIGEMKVSDRVEVRRGELDRLFNGGFVVAVQRIVL